MAGGAGKIRPTSFAGNGSGENEAFPEARRQRRQRSIDNEASGLGVAQCVKPVAYLLRVEMWKPVDAKSEVIIGFVQRAGAPRGKAKDGRAAHTDMRDEQGAALAEFGGGDRYFDGFKRDAREFAQPRKRDVKREERRHRRFEGVAEINGQLARSGGATTPRRQHETTTHEAFATWQSELETAIVAARDVIDGGVGPEFDIGGAGGLKEAVNNRLR